MKMFVNLIILVMVCSGAVMLYQKLDSMGPEFEPQSPPTAQTETAAETKPAAPETSVQPVPATPAPATAETPAPPTAATPEKPVTSAPSTESAAQPAAQPAAPATPMAEQPATPATAPATPEKPATPVAEQPPTPAAPVQPATPTPAAALPPPPTVLAAPAKPVVVASTIPAPESAIPAPAAAAPPPAPAAQAPVQVATAMPPPAPAPVAPQVPQKKLTEMTQDDLMPRLPASAKVAYRMAHSAAESRGDMIGMRSWFSQWRRYLADPMRAVMEVDMAKLLIQSKASYPNEAAAKAAKRGDANEAKMLLSGIISRRINNAELSEMVDKVRQDVDRELEQLK